MRNEMLNLIQQFTGQKNILTIPATFVKFLGDHASALLVSQLLYWTDRSKDGWVYKRYTDWQDELGLSKKQVMRIKNSLEKKGFIETKLCKVGDAPILHYKLTETFADALYSHLQQETETLESAVHRIVPKGNNGLCPKGTISYSKDYLHEITNKQQRKFDEIPESERTRQDYMNKVASYFHERYGDSTFKKIVVPYFKGSKQQTQWRYLLWVVETFSEKILHADEPLGYMIAVAASQNNWQLFLMSEHRKVRAAENGVPAW